jgi:hypothetical protein
MTRVDDDARVLGYERDRQIGHLADGSRRSRRWSVLSPARDNIALEVGFRGHGRDILLLPGRLGRLVRPIAVYRVAPNGRGYVIGCRRSANARG